MRIQPVFARQGFTLIEITVVILLISIMLVFVAPRLPDAPFSDPADKTTRWIMLKVADLKYRALREQKTYVLHAGVDRERFWITREDMSDEEREAAEAEGFALPGGLNLRDIEFPGGETVGSGTAEIRFYPKGYSDRAILHLTDGERRFSFQIEPFLPEVKRLDSLASYGG